MHRRKWSSGYPCLPAVDQRPERASWAFFLQQGVLQATAVMLSACHNGDPTWANVWVYVQGEDVPERLLGHLKRGRNVFSVELRVLRRRSAVHVANFNVLRHQALL